MKKLSISVILYCLISFCHAAEEKPEKLKTWSQLSDGTSKFEIKCQHLQQLNRMANNNYKYFKIINKAGMNIYITLQKGNQAQFNAVCIPPSIWDIFGKYNQLEILSDADKFEFVGYQRMGHSVCIYKSPISDIEDNTVYKVDSSSSDLIIKKAE
jgi:hypothetical protein